MIKYAEKYGLENEISEEFIEQRLKDLEEIHELGRAYIKKYGHPHTYITMDIVRAEVIEGVTSYVNKEYRK